jgi:hypothetical protein
MPSEIVPRNLLRIVYIRPVIRSILLLSVLAIALACGRDAAGPGPDPVGAYTLVAYNGHPLPYVTVSDVAGTIEISAGTETLGADSLYSENWTQRVKYNGGYGCGCVDSLSGFVESGKYELVGTRLTFHPGIILQAYGGSLVNGVLTYTAPTRSLVNGVLTYGPPIRSLKYVKK